MPQTRQGEIYKANAVHEGARPQKFSIPRSVLGPHGSGNPRRLGFPECGSAGALRENQSWGSFTKIAGTAGVTIRSVAKVKAFGEVPQNNFHTVFQCERCGGRG